MHLVRLIMKGTLSTKALNNDPSNNLCPLIKKATNSSAFVSNQTSVEQQPRHHHRKTYGHLINHS